MSSLRKWLVSALIIAGFAGAVWWWLARDGTHPEHSESSETGHSHASSGKRQPASPGARVTPLTSSVVAGSPLVRTELTSPTPAADTLTVTVASRPESQPEARADLEGVRFMLRDFRTRMNENPVGSNGEIMRAVMGENPAHATLGPPTGQSLNADGELVDRWSTPYFFHQLSKTSMEIRSAGPDRQLWTDDDLVTK